MSDVQGGGWGGEGRRGRTGAGDSPGSWLGSNETSTKLEQSRSSKNTYAYTRVWSANRHFASTHTSTTPGRSVDANARVYSLEFAATEKAAFGPGANKRQECQFLFGSGKSQVLLQVAFCSQRQSCGHFDLVSGRMWHEEAARQSAKGGSVAGATQSRYHEPVQQESLAHWLIYN